MNLEKKLTIPHFLPFLPVRDAVVFPQTLLPLAVGREKSIRAVEEAMATHRLIFISTQKKLNVEEPDRDSVFDVGVVGEILQILKIPDGTIKVLVEGLCRAKMLDFYEKDGHNEVEIVQLSRNSVMTPDIEAAMRNAVHLFEEYTKLNKRLPLDAAMNLVNVDDPDRLVDTIAAHILIKVKDKQALLEAVDIVQRIELLAKILTSENEILGIEKKIQGRIRGQIEKSQKEFYLNEQMKAIQKELKHKDDHSRDMEELDKKIISVGMSKEAEEVALKELARVSKMMPFSPEATVSRTYIDWLVSLPWNERTEDRLDIDEAQRVLDEDHYGLEKAKERILEYLAVCKLAKKLKGPILCFVGPPGVGKTSLGRSIARAMGRNFTRLSLGGMRDEAEIRGHRRTYIGALPGRIIQSLKKVKSRNPVFVLDEIDKLGMDFRGDPSSALLEVLDPEQNNTFSDHYLEVAFDLSDVMFITTANTLHGIPPALLDRMEIIRFAGYTAHEKLHIAKKYLIPKQTKENGLSENDLHFEDTAISVLIEKYTQEAGVRNLEREIGSICRKVAKNKARTGETTECVNVTEQKIHDYLGAAKYRKDMYAENEVGVATGLAWTEFGGDVLNVEVSIMPAKQGLSLTLTGKLGDVMKESAQAALSYIRSHADELGIPKTMLQSKEVHIHVPEGAIPKDGPSAGVTIVTALVSAFTGKPVRKNVAMTGEITLRGRVLPIGGLKEKMLAAHRVGMKEILFPFDNEKDLEEIPKDVQKSMELIRVKHISEVIDKAIVKI